MITCEFENGSKANLRHVTVNTIIVKNNKILLGRRSDAMLLEAGKWGLIGGFMERNETFEMTAKREALEETGWEIENLKLFKINDNPNRPAEDRQNVDIIFIAEAKEKVGTSDEEVSDLQWFSLEDLPPKEKIAFDHGDHLELYKKMKK